MASTFVRSYVANRDQIERLKFALYESKREVFYRENVDIFSELSLSSKNFPLSRESFLCDINKKLSEPLRSNNEDYQKFLQNVEFISNIVKLKNFTKSYRFSENNNQLVLECLTLLFKQIDYFLHIQLKSEGEHKIVSFPIESIFHAIQLFINIYEIEWFYYLRDNLLVLINNMLRSLVEQFVSVDSLNLLRVNIF